MTRPTRSKEEVSRDIDENRGALREALLIIRERNPVTVASRIVQATLLRWRGKARATTQEADATIRFRPYRSLGIALISGLIAGGLSRMIARRKRARV